MEHSLKNVEKNLELPVGNKNKFSKYCSDNAKKIKKGILQPSWYSGSLKFYELLKHGKDMQNLLLSNI